MPRTALTLFIVTGLLFPVWPNNVSIAIPNKTNMTGQDRALRNVPPTQSPEPGGSRRCSPTPRSLKLNSVRFAFQGHCSSLSQALSYQDRHGRVALHGEQVEHWVKARKRLPFCCFCCYSRCMGWFLPLAVRRAAFFSALCPERRAQPRLPADVSSWGSECLESRCLTASGAAAAAGQGPRRWPLGSSRGSSTPQQRGD